MATELTDANFKEIVLDSGKVAMIDFWAPWCGPCKTIGPVIEEIAKEYEGKVIVGKVDVDDNSAISLEYGIRNIPAVLFFKDGKIVDKQIGAAPKATYTKKLETLLAVEETPAS